MNLLKTPLFADISEEGLADIQAQGYIRRQTFQKNEYVLEAGDQTFEIGMILLGSVCIESTDLWGNKSILSRLAAGKIFAETYALCKEPLLVDVVAAEHTQILFLNLQLLQHGKNGCAAWYLQLLHNLLRMSARNNLSLSRRIFCTAAKNVRSRVLTYLSAQAVHQGSKTFTIPFNRQQMADYLNVDRSALSKELCRMRDAGMLMFYKNRFTLLHMDK